jgi:hypothetical protein
MMMKEISFFQIFYFYFLAIFGIISTVVRVSFVLLPIAPPTTLKPTQGNQIGTEYSKGKSMHYYYYDGTS